MKKDTGIMWVPTISTHKEDKEIITAAGKRYDHFLCKNNICNKNNGSCWRHRGVDSNHHHQDNSGNNQDRRDSGNNDKNNNSGGRRHKDRY